MPFKFAYLCELFAELDTNRYRKAITTPRMRDYDRDTVSKWFSKYQSRIHNGHTDRHALLSCLFPERRRDRVLFMKEATLVRTIGKCLYLGMGRKMELDQWRVAGRGDLGECVARVMAQSENQEGPITLEEIDCALNEIAARCRFSGSDVRQHFSGKSVEDILRPLFLAMTSDQAKWFVRMILRDYRPIIVPEKHVISAFHPLLLKIMKFQDNLDAAVKLLEHPDIKGCGSDSAMWDDVDRFSHLLIPQVGVKVGRPIFFKARSLKHCCDMAAGRRMSLERKYDGEYCQIHIDLTTAGSPFTIFSKSGKDSTLDREAIHDTLWECLRLGRGGSKIQKHAILEGELVVWSMKDKQIAPFDKLRKHVSRSGVLLGTDEDSPPSDECLMISLYDVLLVDDTSYLLKSQETRRRLLKEAVQPIPGRAKVADRVVVDFSLHHAHSQLSRLFAKAIRRRWEGLVLKGTSDPYISIGEKAHEFSSCWIKLKKDNVAGCGDTADLSIIGAGYDPRDALELNEVPNLSWTRFHIGCLENREETIRFGERPVFRHIGFLDRRCMSKDNVATLNQFGQFRRLSSESEQCVEHFLIRHDQTYLPKMTDIFKSPFVVEVMGGGFTKPPNVRYYTLRFPRLQKIHIDRTFEAAVTFLDLQVMAEDALHSTRDSSCPDSAWVRRLEKADRKLKYIVNKSETTTPSTPSSLSKRSDADKGSDARLHFAINADATSAMSPELCHIRSLDVLHGPSLRRKKRLIQEPVCDSRLGMSKRRKCNLELAGTATGSTKPNARSRKADVTRRPLVELENLSPEQIRESVQRPMAGSREHQPLIKHDKEVPAPYQPSSLPMTSLNSNMKTKQSPTHFHQKSRSYYHANDATFPTPPTSSDELSKSTSAQSRHIKRAEVPESPEALSMGGESASPAAPRLPAVSIPHFVTMTQLPILLAPNLAASPPPKLFTILSNISALFTLSQTTFLLNLSSPQTSRPVIGVVLISTDTEETGRLISEVGTRLAYIERRGYTLPSDRGKVLFLESGSFVRLFDMHVAEQGLENVFCGCIKWGPWDPDKGSKGAEDRKTEVRDSWDWHEMLHLK